MNEETRILLVDLIDGKITDSEVEFIEVMTGKKSNFQKLTHFSITDFIKNTYLIKLKPKRPIIAPEIWAVLPDDYAFIQWTCDSIPVALSPKRPISLSMNGLKGLDLNGCDWKESKVMRP